MRRLPATTWVRICRPVPNFSSQHLANLISQTESVPAVNQVELHPFFTQDALCDFHADHGIATQAWSPLGGVNVYSLADPKAANNPLEHPIVAEISARYGKTPAQVVLRWHLDQGRSAIPKSVQPHRIAENISIFDFALTQNEIAAIDALDTGIRGGPDPELIDLQHYPFKVEN